MAAEAPDVKQAEAKLDAANRDLAQAELDLRYCDVVAEIDGVITRRNVNPGDNVQVGQGLMAIRSLREIWVDANFKETQLRDLRIGQPVDLYVDMYGDRQVFKGRITGFTIGTGSTLALLPAQNATGNFIKVVQRLPVRIELEDYDPDKNPLFIGTSVVPYVYLNKPPTGPNAGKFLQADCRARRPRVRLRARRAPTNDGRGAFHRPASRADINPWLVAAIVVVPTFMEVLDTTIAVVALALYRRRPVGDGRRRRMGHHQLPRRQRHHPADHRLAVGASRPPQLLPVVDRRLHPRLRRCAAWRPASAS